MSETAQREALSAFLKNRRARLSPAEAGFPDTKRRRTPGLRREEIAALSGVSVTWYTHLEQGRDVRASIDVLERLASALQLSSAERQYLFELGQSRPAPIPPGEIDALPPALLTMIEALNLPAYVISMRWDVLAWNPMCTEVLRDYDALPRGERNLLKILFSQTDYPKDRDEYLAMARRLVAKLRIDYSQFPGDPGLEKLVADLKRDFSVFRELWATPEVEARSEGVSVLDHPVGGAMRLQHSSYVPEGCPTLRLVMFAPLDAESSKALQTVHGQLVQTA